MATKRATSIDEKIKALQVKKERQDKKATLKKTIADARAALKKI